MTKFRRHDVELARREAEARRAAATARHPVHSPAWHAEYALLKLQDVVRLGLMDCYTSFADSLSDFYPDLPWAKGGAAESLRLILADPRFPPIRAAILSAHGFDLEAELQAALRDEGS